MKYGQIGKILHEGCIKQQLHENTFVLTIWAQGFPEKRLQYAKEVRKDKIFLKIKGSRNVDFPKSKDRQANRKGQHEWKSQKLTYGQKYRRNTTIPGRELNRERIFHHSDGQQDVALKYRGNKARSREFTWWSS